MSQAYYIGLDPGQDGALAILGDSGDEPVLIMAWDKDTKRKAGHYRLRQWAPPMETPVTIYRGNQFSLTMIHLHMELESLLIRKDLEGYPVVEELYIPPRATKSFVELAETTGAQLLALEGACLRDAKRVKAAMWRKRLLKLPQFSKRKYAHAAEQKFGKLIWGGWVKWRAPQHVWAALWLARYARLAWAPPRATRR